VVSRTGVQLVEGASWAWSPWPSTCGCATAGGAEAALAVVDAHHGRGIGTRLLEQLRDDADATGVEVFEADVLPTDPSALVGHRGKPATAAR
jgi:GNAT superfamily N-acetyltransferase